MKINITQHTSRILRHLSSGALVATAAFAENPPFATVNFGADPGGPLPWGSRLESTTQSVQTEFGGSYAGYRVGAYGGGAPSVSASAWALYRPPPYDGNASGAFCGGQVTWAYRVVPGPSPSPSGQVPVTMTFYARFSVSQGGPYAHGNGRIWVSSAPVSGGDGWHYTSGGGWGIEWDVQPNTDLTVSGTPTFMVPYNEWSPVVIYAGNSLSTYSWTAFQRVSAVLDPSMALSAEWQASHPGDRIELLTLTPPATTLSVSRTATNTVVLSWPLPDVGWRLRCTTNLSATPTWTEIPPPYATNATSLLFIEPAVPGNKFYRLQWP